MKTRIESHPGAVVAAAEGRLDFGAAPGFQAELEKLLAPGAGAAAVIVDCSALEYVSSAGLRAFLVGARAAQRAGRSFALCTLKPAVREVFELSGFHRIIGVHADRATALAQLAPLPAAAQRDKSVVAEAGELAPLTRFLQEFWLAHKLPPQQALAFELALEEVFMNVVTHGSAGGGRVQVQVSLRLEGGSLVMTLTDDGPEFNPLTLPAPDLAAPLADRRVGGHGVSLVRQMMESVTYRRVGTRNELTMQGRAGA